MSSFRTAAEGAGNRNFATTRWSVVLAAADRVDEGSRVALESLCQTYWYPLYAYARRRGLSAADAQDLTQGFFTMLLERDRLPAADRQRGRFRSFLLASLNHYLSNQWRAESAQKRGGHVHRLSLDVEVNEQRYQREPAHELTAEKLYERRWALTLLDAAIDRLADEYAEKGKQPLFESLRHCLGGPDPGESYQTIAERLEMTEGAVKVAVHRLRKRCRELLRAEIAQTVATESEVDDELRALFSAIAP